MKRIVSIKNFTFLQFEVFDLLWFSSVQFIISQFASAVHEWLPRKRQK